MSTWVSPSRQDELTAITKAQGLAVATGHTHTVWHDCAALEAVVTLGTTPPRDRAVMRVQVCVPESIPHWAGSVVRNYRAAFATAYGHEFPGTDVDVFRIQRDEPVLPSGEEQDEAVLHSMRDHAMGLAAIAA